VLQSSLSDSRHSKFGWNPAGGSIEISDFGADVNNRAPLNYSVFTRQVQLGQSTIWEALQKYKIISFGEIKPICCRSGSGKIPDSSIFVHQKT